ncbi:MAG: nuclear transport factor 2 family protein [Mycetocola sp.]
MNETRWAELEAREAIRDQLHAYCRSMDRCDHALGYAVWHHDGTADYGDVYRGSGRGFVDQTCKSHLRLEAHSHQVTSVGITVRGARAVSEAYVTAALRFRDADGAQVTVIRGRYVDTWSRREGRWAIDHRAYLHDFDQVVRVDDERMTGVGRRDRDDPSYAVLESL